MLLPLCFFYAQQSYAQLRDPQTSRFGKGSAEPGGSRAYRMLLDKKFAAKITLGPMLPLGAEYYFNDTWGVVLEAGLPIALSDKEVTMRYNLRFRTELRKYCIIRWRHRFFTGMEAWIHAKDILLHNYEVSTDIYRWQVSSAHIYRQHLSVGATFGEVIRISKHGLMEWFVGVHMEQFKADLVSEQGRSTSTSNNAHNWIPTNSAGYYNSPDNKRWSVTPSIGLKFSHVFTALH